MQSTFEWLTVRSAIQIMSNITVNKSKEKLRKLFSFHKLGFQPEELEISLNLHLLNLFSKATGRCYVQSKQRFLLIHFCLCVLIGQDVLRICGFGILIRWPVATNFNNYIHCFLIFCIYFVVLLLPPEWIFFLQSTTTLLIINYWYLLNYPAQGEQWSYIAKEDWIFPESSAVPITLN